MENKKNVIWLVTDQQRAETLSINGCRNASTPNLDLLARTGVNIRSAYSGFPLCCPFRGSMLTGRYPHHCVPGHEYQLPPEMPTIAGILNVAGYDTFYLGKWHLDGAKESEERAGTHYVPRDRRGGFGSWLGYENNNAQYDCYLHGHRHEEEVPMFRIPGYETDGITDLLLEYLNERKEDGKPFFAVMSIQPPHDPYVAPAGYQKGHNPADIIFRENVPDIGGVREQAAVELAGYYAMVENIDANVGRIVEMLSESGMMENTHILYFSDHGDMHGSHGQFRKTIPYQEAVNVPFLISGERRSAHVGGRRTGQVEDILVNHVDIAPTTLGLCGIPVPDDMEGRDLSWVRLMDQEPGEAPDSLYLQSVIPTGHWDSVNKPWRGIITRDGYKYVCLEQMDWMMYDLKKDPYEQQNLVHNNHYRELRERLNRRLRQWVEETGDEFPL